MSSRVAYGSYSWKPGRYVAGDASSETFFSSTSMAIDAAVNALDDEPIAKMVFSSTRSGLPNARTPYPLT
ncbi:MAG: hypothetical protein IPK33_10205 [Gemmatimonadetes bacterium]|nr:hypothetical protein [Gemmatimonadota bacterium]